MPSSRRHVKAIVTARGGRRASPAPRGGGTRRPTRRRRRALASAPPATRGGRATRQRQSRRHQSRRRGRRRGRAARCTRRSRTGACPRARASTRHSRSPAAGRPTALRKRCSPPSREAARSCVARAWRREPKPRPKAGHQPARRLVAPVAACSRGAQKGAPASRARSGREGHTQPARSARPFQPPRRRCVRELFTPPSASQQTGRGRGERAGMGGWMGGRGQGGGQRHHC